MSLDVECDQLGSCVACGAVIPAEALLVKFAPAEGWPRILATCPSCGTVGPPA